MNKRTNRFESWLFTSFNFVLLEATDDDSHLFPRIRSTAAGGKSLNSLLRPFPLPVETLTPFLELKRGGNLMSWRHLLQNVMKKDHFLCTWNMHLSQTQCLWSWRKGWWETVFSFPLGNRNISALGEECQTKSLQLSKYFGVLPFLIGKKKINFWQCSSHVAPGWTTQAFPSNRMFWC